MIRLAVFAALVLAAPALSAEAPGGIKGCIDSRIKDGTLQLTHVIEGTGDVISRDEWVIQCDGLAGLAAWDQFYALRRDDPADVVGPDGGHALFMKTGVGSRCMKLIRNADGSPAPAKAVCEISIDLDPEFYQRALGQ